jgi:hypothetical protein
MRARRLAMRLFAIRPGADVDVAGGADLASLGGGEYALATMSPSWRRRLIRAGPLK